MFAAKRGPRQMCRHEVQRRGAETWRNREGLIRESRPIVCCHQLELKYPCGYDVLCSLSVSTYAFSEVTPTANSTASICCAGLRFHRSQWYDKGAAPWEVPSSQAAIGILSLT